ncbi:MAG: crossover junction endodeoxyribonuclease RuvC [Desulfobacteraceae bacterium]|nr:crossover junction endodeoxyribonuclease RuvC [Desulfobacteraceae bacterium]
MSIKILGIDPGLASTGIGIIQGYGSKVLHYAYGTIKTSPKQHTAVRLEIIYNQLCRLLGEENPQILIVEDVFSLECYPKSGIALGKVCGVVMLAGQQSGLKSQEIPVREAKQVLTGNGNASKAQLEMAVRQILSTPEPIKPFHASDALGLALIGLYRFGRAGYENMK